LRWVNIKLEIVALTQLDIFRKDFRGKKIEQEERNRFWTQKSFVRSLLYHQYCPEIHIFDETLNIFLYFQDKFSIRFLYLAKVLKEVKMIKYLYLVTKT